MFTLSEEMRHAERAADCVEKHEMKYLSGLLDDSKDLTRMYERFAPSDRMCKKILRKKGLIVADGELNENYAFTLKLMSQAAMRENGGDATYYCSWFGVNGFEKDFKELFPNAMIACEPYANCFDLIRNLERRFLAGQKIMVVESLDWLLDLDADFNFVNLLEHLGNMATDAGASIYLTTTIKALRKAGWLLPQCERRAYYNVSISNSDD